MSDDDYRTPFSQAAYDRNDQRSRDELIHSQNLRRILSDRFGVYDFEDNKDKYGVDFVAASCWGKGIPAGHVEVEHKERGLSFHPETGNFRWPDISVANRKKELFIQKPVPFVQFDHAYDWAWVFHTGQVRWTVLVEWNRRDQANVPMIKVPCADAVLVKVHNWTKGLDTQVIDRTPDWARRVPHIRQGFIEPPPPPGMLPPVDLSELP